MKFNDIVFVQEYEKSRFAAMESEFRTRSDEAPEQMRKIQDKTRVSFVLNDLILVFSAFAGISFKSSSIRLIIS